MDIVLALLIAYVLGGAIWPQLVRSRQFFLLGFAAVAVTMLLGSIHFGLFVFVARLTELAAFVLLVLAARGGSVDQLWRELRGYV